MSEIEQLLSHNDCVSEYHKLKQQLTLTESERIKWKECANYMKARSFRKCKRCGQIKKRSEYYGRYAVCKECKNKESKARYYKKRIIFYENKIKECEIKIHELL